MLYIGIVVSMLLRAVFIAAGAAAIAAASWVFYIFGAFLIYTAVKLARRGRATRRTSSRRTRMVRGLRRVLPITPDYVGTALTTRTDGRRMVTPLVVVIAAIGIANVVFALDSIPAIFGLTTDPYIILTANAFALMGLRQLYFLIGGLLERIVYLNVGPVGDPRLHRRQAGDRGAARLAHGRTSGRCTCRRSASRRRWCSSW